MARNFRVYDSDDERAPYIVNHVRSSIVVNDDDNFIPLTHIMRDYFREEREKLYYNNFDNDMNNRVEDIWWNPYWYDMHIDLYDDLYDTFSIPTYNNNNDNEEKFDHVEDNVDQIDITPVEDSEGKIDEHEFDPIRTDPLFCNAANKFAYV